VSERREPGIPASSERGPSGPARSAESGQVSGPLAGIRVVMMGGLGPAPFCGMLLGDLGADVVRVDRVTDVDRPAHIDTLMRRSQRSIAVDMKHAEGRELLYALTAGVDAFVDVYRPGAAERLGIGPDELLTRNPRLVYARMTGWGQDGPYAQMAGHDINYLALAGALHAIGPPETPVPPLNLLGDYGGGGMLLAVGLLGGILEARQSGTGQVVDVAMFDGAAMLMTVFYGLFAEGRWEDRRGANVIDGASHYYRAYETADGKHFAVGAMEPQFYEELCARLGVTVPQDDTPEAWAAHGATMAARFREKTRDEWEDELVTPQSCASPVLGLGEAPDHPHSRARETFVTVDGVVQPAPAPRFSRTTPDLPAPPALPGDHTLAVLAELDVDGAALLDAGVVRQSTTVRGS
jgi:alpha-methylacyl-CoA racemase